MPKFVEAAVAAIRRGETPANVSRYFDEDLPDLPVGEVRLTPDGWIVRARERDLAFSCGFDCCGVEFPALLKIEEA